MPKWSKFLDYDEDDELPRETVQKIKRDKPSADDMKIPIKKKPRHHDNIIPPLP